MSVELSPRDTLGFHRPLTMLVKRTLTVFNPNKAPVAFKVKTTAPKQYCVRPNSARLEPGERVEVQVLLQPMKEDPAEDAKCKDKFLVQSVAIIGELESLPLNEIWASLERHKDSISEQKIRCVYLPALDANGYTPPDYAQHEHDATDNDIAETHDAVDSPPRSRSLSHTAVNDAALGARGPSPALPDSAATDSPAADAKPLAQIVKEVGSKPIVESAKEAGSSIAVQGAAAGAAVAGAAAAASSAVSSKAQSAFSAAPSYSTAAGQADPQVASLQKQLAAAQKEITRLQGQLKASEGGKPVGGAGRSDSSIAFAQQISKAGAEGVPFTTAAVWGLIIFLFTWLFF